MADDPVLKGELRSAVEARKELGEEMELCARRRVRGADRARARGLPPHGDGVALRRDVPEVVADDLQPAGAGRPSTPCVPSILPVARSTAVSRSVPRSPGSVSAQTVPPAIATVLAIRPLECSPNWTSAIRAVQSRATARRVDARQGPVLGTDDHARVRDHREVAHAGRARGPALAVAGARVEAEQPPVLGARPQIVAGEPEGLGEHAAAEVPIDALGDGAAARVDPDAPIRTEQPKRAIVAEQLRRRRTMLEAGGRDAGGDAVARRVDPHQRRRRVARVDDDPDARRRWPRCPRAACRPGCARPRGGSRGQVARPHRARPRRSTRAEAGRELHVRVGDGTGRRARMVGSGLSDMRATTAGPCLTTRFSSWPRVSATAPSTTATSTAAAAASPKPAARRRPPRPQPREQPAEATAALAAGARPR